MAGAWETSGAQRRSRPPRLDHRSQHDRQAHAEQPADSPPPSHPLSATGPASLVGSSDQLAELLEHLRSAGSFAFDSEFIGEMSYVPKLCLIQVATSARVALIDPLVGFDLTPFWQILAEPGIQKIVHAGQQDIEPVFRHIGRPAANLFDAQIAAGFAGLGYPLALAKLVNAVIDVKLTKGLTFSHWDRRPLSAQQLRYAADDVRFLPAVRMVLGKRLETLGHAEWVAEESNSLADPSLYEFDAESAYLKIRGAGSLHARNLAILRELTLWRDQTAKVTDMPARSLLRDEVLLELSRNPVDSVENLRRVRGLPRPVESEYGEEIVAAIARGHALPPEQLPSTRFHEPTPREKFCADALWASAQCLCAGRQIDPNAVTSRQEIGEIYRCYLAGQETDDFRLMRGWRREALGQHIIELLAGKLRLSAKWVDGALALDKGD
ncbi:MAG: HRDC domain-containing protein [Tepidisphaeraceae bacterium]